MSKYSGKCDFYDWYSNATEEDRKHVTIVYNDFIEIHPTDIADFIPWYPYVGGMSSQALTDKGYRETTFFFYGKSYIDSRESEIISMAIDLLFSILVEINNEVEKGFKNPSDIPFEQITARENYQLLKIYEDKLYEQLYKKICKYSLSDKNDVSFTTVHVSSINRYRLELIKAFEEAGIESHACLRTLKRKVEEFNTDM